MYSFLLIVHSWLRWFALAAVIVVVIRAMRGAAGANAWEPEEPWIKGAAHLLTAQAMIGIVLYAVSPYIRGLLGDMSTTMQDRTSRLLAVEHAVIMVIVVALAHMGFAIARKAKTEKARHQRTAIFFGIGLILMAYAIPWVRPLFRFG
jgi:hypothetical protein